MTKATGHSGDPDGDSPTSLAARNRRVRAGDCRRPRLVDRSVSQCSALAFGSATEGIQVRIALPEAPNTLRPGPT